MPAELPIEGNPWRYWLEEEPLAAWGAGRPQAGSRGFINYWKGQQGDVWGNYQGALGQLAASGQPPNLNWSDYLENYDWEGRYGALSPTEKGYQNRLYAPRIRWQFG